MFRELWNRPALRTRGLQNEPVMIFETWFLSPHGSARCELSRQAALGEDVSQWEQLLRRVWRDKVSHRSPAELIIGRSSTQVPAGGGHLILTQHVDDDARAVLASIFQEGGGQPRIDTVAILTPRRIECPDILDLLHLHSSALDVCFAMSELRTFGRRARSVAIAVRRSH